ncbi:RNA/RNP complex-1-interacting phosphatase [Lampris incognitus]|uniref:RNA/RNP complex-1-interacting phosphatase n=1 Tax=Lampris incognitus TaxID=2546036 RepID=UPI0024B559DD|nr:RNA/RNP complex-1-interacting phosphatase [Lampris incognitus]
MASRKKKNGIPDRWLDYQPVGRRITGTRFIVFKVPLKPSLCLHVPESDAFGHWELLDTLKKENQELGLIIDLTFTKRYYKLQDIPQSWCYVKILTAGHEVPNNETILSFKRAVRHFLRENPDNDKLIGVHCTHGLNRSGYLVCRYLIDVEGYNPKEAVRLFNSARGHSIERQNYLKDLHLGPIRSNQGMEETEEEPLRGLAADRPCSAPIPYYPRGGECYSQSTYREGGCYSQSTVSQSGIFHQLPRGGLHSPPVLMPYRMGAPLFPYQWRRPEDIPHREPPPGPQGNSSIFRPEEQIRSAPNPFLHQYTPHDPNTQYLSQRRGRRGRQRHNY